MFRLPGRCSTVRIIRWGMGQRGTGAGETRPDPNGSDCGNTIEATVAGLSLAAGGGPAEWLTWRWP